MLHIEHTICSCVTWLYDKLSAYDFDIFETDQVETLNSVLS